MSNDYQYGDLLVDERRRCTHHEEELLKLDHRVHLDGFVQDWPRDLEHPERGQAERPQSLVVGVSADLRERLPGKIVTGERFGRGSLSGGSRLCQVGDSSSLPDTSEEETSRHVLERYSSSGRDGPRPSEESELWRKGADEGIVSSSDRGKRSCVIQYPERAYSLARVKSGT